MTFFMPAQQALERIPDMKLSALAGIQLAEVRIYGQTWGNCNSNCNVNYIFSSPARSA